MATTMQRDVFIASHGMDQAQGLLVDDGLSWHDKWSVYDNSIDESIVHISKVGRHRIYICIRQILFQEEETEPRMIRIPPAAANSLLCPSA
jgi:hypothetical protein